MIILYICAQYCCKDYVNEGVKIHKVLVKAKVVCLQWRRYVTMETLYLPFTTISRGLRHRYTSRNVGAKFENEEELAFCLTSSIDHPPS